MIDVKQVVKVLKQAGHIINDYYQKADLNIFAKTDNSPVTEADHAVDVYLTAELRSILNIPVISEENLEYVSHNPDTYWLLDPIDGTGQFIQGNDQFCISLALIYETKPAYGFIYVPVTDELYYSVDRRFYFNEHQEEFENNDFTRAVVSKKTMPDSEQQVFRELNITEFDYIKSAIKYGKLITTPASFYMRTHNSCIWDVAAGHAILKTHGFNMYDLINGDELSYNLNNIYNNPFVVLHESKLNKLNRIIDIFDSYK